MYQRWIWAVAAACVVLVGSAAHGATASYDYDALGRLTRVLYSDGKAAVYRYDSAGNRTMVVSGALPGIPATITVPASSMTGAYAVSWGVSTGTVTTYELFESTSSSFAGQVLVYSGTALSATFSGRGGGNYYYRVRACLGPECSGYRTGSNGVSVVGVITVLNPAIQVGATGYTTQISTLANLNGIAATISTFTEMCQTASVAIQADGQSVKWTNANTYLAGCEAPSPEQCGATYTIKNTSSGQTYSGTSSITLAAQAKSLPAGTSCP